VTDEPTTAETSTVDPLAAMLDRPLTEMTVDELMAIKAEFAKHGVRVYNSLPPEVWVFLGLAAIYSKAFLEALARRHADALADLVRTRFRKNGKTTELSISVDGGASAVVVVTGDLPDEARLALLDLDLMADEMRGKELRWDDDTSAWRPDPGQ
jgi:hypothetical protein